MVLIATYFIHCESLTKELFKNKFEINVKTFIRSDTVILSTTIIKTKILKFFFFNDSSKVSVHLNAIKSADTCTSRFILITKIAFINISIVSTFVIYIITTFIFRTINNVSSYNATISFDFISSSRQTLLKTIESTILFKSLKFIVIAMLSH